jgi:hypothetical protein
LLAIFHSYYNNNYHFQIPSVSTYQVNRHNSATLVLQRKSELWAVKMAQYYTVSTVLFLGIAVTMALWNGIYARVRNVSLTLWSRRSSS